MKNRLAPSRLQFVLQIVGAPAGSADEHQGVALTQRGGQPGVGLQEHPDVLARLDGADVQQVTRPQAQARKHRGALRSRQRAQKRAPTVVRHTHPLRRPTQMTHDLVAHRRRHGEQVTRLAQCPLEVAAELFDAPGRVHRFMRKHPELAERIPKKQLAAYLNLSAETLSRLKQRGKI